MTVAEIASRMDEPASSDGADELGDDRDPSEVFGERDRKIPPADAIGSESIADRLKQPLEGSIYDAEIGELWSPEDGAENRLLLVAEELGGLEGIPRGFHVLIGFAELLVKHSDDEDGSTSSDDPDEDDEPDEIDATTREVLEYEP